MFMGSHFSKERGGHHWYVSAVNSLISITPTQALMHFSFKFAQVQLVLNHTHTANYKVEDLPQDVRDRVVRELTKLKSDLVKRGKRYDIKASKHKLNLNHYPNKLLRMHKKWAPHSAFQQPENGRFLMEVNKFAEIDHSAMKYHGLQEFSGNKSKLVQYGFKAPGTSKL